MGIEMQNTSPAKYKNSSEFFRFPGLATLDPDAYFRCLDVLRRLFDDPDFKTSTSRFYFNYITNLKDDYLNSLRLVYDAIDPPKAQAAIRAFVEKNKDRIAIFESAWTVRPDATQPWTSEEGEGARFRNFLYTNSRIFLDVIQKFGVRPIQELIYRYRYDSLAKRVPPENVLGETFGQSDYFRKLREVSLDKQYWNDLTHRFNDNDFGLHFLVNMSCVPERWGYEPFFGEDWIKR
ncbi:MAG: hypothetical protein ABSA41_11540 [Terriglobia bacterium]|jgi:hypothetical protein